MEPQEKTKRIGLIDLSVRIIQLLVSIIALAGIGVSAYFIGSTTLLLIAIIAIVIIAFLGLVDREKNSWYGRLNALQSQRLKMEISHEPLKGTLRMIYRESLRTNYQYALLEKRMELANDLKSMLDEVAN